MWESEGCKFLCETCVFPYAAFLIYRGECYTKFGCKYCGVEHYERDIRSVFTIQYAPLQVFEMIRKQIGYPGFRANDRGLE